MSLKRSWHSVLDALKAPFRRGADKAQAALRSRPDGTRDEGLLHGMSVL